jgi:uncharacterized cupin superfamily protein
MKNGQELLCILRGSLELVHGEQNIQMLEGDSVHFWSYPEKQNITNKSKELAIALWIGTL